MNTDEKVLDLDRRISNLENMVNDILKRETEPTIKSDKICCDKLNKDESELNAAEFEELSKYVIVKYMGLFRKLIAHPKTIFIDNNEKVGYFTDTELNYTMYRTEMHGDTAMSIQPFYADYADGNGIPYTFSKGTFYDPRL